MATKRSSLDTEEAVKGYIPTLEEIAQACLEINSEWDEPTRISRIANDFLKSIPAMVHRSKRPHLNGFSTMPYER